MPHAKEGGGNAPKVFADRQKRVEEIYKKKTLYCTAPDTSVWPV